MSSKKRKKTRRRSGTNNILVFKLIDPILQSLLFIFFIYSIDTDSDTSYRSVLQLLVCLQLVSMVINFFISDENQLKNERFIYLGTIGLYLISFFIIGKTVNPKYVEVIMGSGPVKMDMLEIILMSVAVVISFWYFTICFREIRGLLKTEGGDD
jgi:hypothetical protein